MKVLRITLMVLGVVHILFVGLGVIVANFADADNLWARLLLTFLHPIAAITILALVYIPKPLKPIASAAVVILTINIVADVVVAALIASGSIKGDWALPLYFSVTPTIAIVYAVLVLRSDDELYDAEQ